MLYVTILRIYSEGVDEFDAGEKAGEIIDIDKIEKDVIVECEPTRVNNLSK